MLGLTIDFSSTITLGAILIAAAIALSRAIFGVKYQVDNKVKAERIVTLEDVIEDRDRTIREREERLNQLGAEKDREAQGHAAAEAHCQALEKQIEQMPKYDDVVSLFTLGLERVATEAAQRQSDFLKVVTDKDNAHEARAQERHANQLEVSNATLAVLKDIHEEVKHES